jgi:hypothetical protein
MVHVGPLFLSGSPLVTLRVFSYDFVRISNFPLPTSTKNVAYMLYHVLVTFDIIVRKEHAVFVFSREASLEKKDQALDVHIFDSPCVRTTGTVDWHQLLAASLFARQKITDSLLIIVST